MSFIEKLMGKNSSFEKVGFSTKDEINRVSGFAKSSPYRPNRFIESFRCEIIESRVVDKLNGASKRIEERFYTVY